MRAMIGLFSTYVAMRAWREPPADFTLVLLRLIDRALFHSVEVLEQFDRNVRLDNAMLNLLQLKDDTVLSCHDSKSKYEIEAFLAAAYSLFDKKLALPSRGKDKPTRLEIAFPGDDPVKLTLSNVFQEAKSVFDASWREFRNHAYHVNTEFRDWGVRVLARPIDGLLTVAIPHAYVVDDLVVDLAQVFVQSRASMRGLFERVILELFGYFSRVYGRPENHMYSGCESLGVTHNVGLTPDGFVHNGRPVQLCA